MADENQDGYEYDVALSFAGEQRAYVEEVARAASELGVRVFYDEYETVGLWGKDLYEHLDWVYRSAARYCVVFASAEYASKVWTNHERKSAQARAIEENSEYILPARFDDTEIPGLRPTVGYIDLKKHFPEEVASMIRGKVGEPQRTNFVPPVPDRLFAALGVDDDLEMRRVVRRQLVDLVEVLDRMTSKERELMFALLTEGCPGELPENIHMSVDLLARILRWPIPEVLQTAGQLRSLGVMARTREDLDHEGDELGGPQTMLVVEFHNMSASEHNGNVSAIAGFLFEDLCVDHARAALANLDFAHLGSATVRPGTIHD